MPTLSFQIGYICDHTKNFPSLNARLLTTTQVLHRERSDGPWTPLGDENTRVVYEEGMMYMVAKFYHFSEGCLAKNVEIEDPVHREKVTFGRPKKKQITFINATQKTLTFLVLPTSCSHSFITSFAVGVGVDGIAETNATVNRACESQILAEAMAPQVFQIAPKKRDGNPKAGERCTSFTCCLPESGGSQARVALVTVEDETVSVWFSLLVHERERFAVLPGQFYPGLQPALGQHQLSKGHRLVDGSYTITSGGSISVQNAPISTISATGDSVGTNAENDAESGS